MAKSRPVRRLSFGEELANAVTHGVSALAVLVLMPFIYIGVYADVLAGKGAVRDLVGVAVFLIAIFLMFLMSTIYHCMSFDSAEKRVMKKLDHIFIYVAIAGTYTPIALSVFWPIPKAGPVCALVVLALQWFMVLFGILYKSLFYDRMPRASLAIYLVMGWTVALFFPMLIRSANPPLFILILLGGLCYSAGAAFYAAKQLKYQHMIWHLFVTAGAFLHMAGIGFFLYR